MDERSEIYIVDAFTDKPFSGNPAGVCLPEKTLSETQMLSIAAELGFSETSFVHKMDNSDSYSIRFFSPKMEIPLCGHATLAASKVLFDKMESTNHLHLVNIEQIDLHIQRVGESIQMEFPVYGTKPEIAPKALLNALGLNKTHNVEYNEETKILLIHIDDCEQLRTMKPDFNALYQSHSTINGVLVTAVSNKIGFDFESRYFWPWSGTNEDPVTGATHTFLANYWGKRLGKKTLNSFQCSKRTGYMKLELVNPHKLIIESTATIVLKGKLTL
ncbi:PhzF family phenazine biosynthesis protein [Flagellimonas lutimaris]|uniref:PhzF family phenazine biosynthesis protein n=1 Tax=Flagellimonas lutimaris TaxID=475082 RepID=UPI003F5CE868